jgi:hypothetical protein
MILTIIESPFAGDVERNLRYLRAAMRDSLLRGEAPYASHALYTQPGVLDDAIPKERELGMAAGWSWMRRASQVAVYEDLGRSGGMQRGIDRARVLGLPIAFRRLGGEWA